MALTLEDLIPLFLRAVKAAPLTSTEMDLNMTRLRAAIADPVTGHTHDGEFGTYIPKITISETAPANPKDLDIWIDISE
ncbi:MAG: hypothetical protein CSYNP_01579 [Syntrophus sp. SKADARSKE-3]|nr:hypothetical protein [Syntrophus sp. SKADARSKE-3]